MRIILEWVEDRESMLDQLNAARSALAGSIREREVWGFRINGSFFGVKRNKDSVRVYPQKETNP